MFRVIGRWHRLLNMRKYDRRWHLDDVRREISELRQARSNLLAAQNLANRSKDASSTWRDLMHAKLLVLSERSDVLYTATRALSAGHDVPFPRSLHPNQ